MHGNVLMAAKAMAGALHVKAGQSGAKALTELNCHQEMKACQVKNSVINDFVKQKRGNIWIM